MTASALGKEIKKKKAFDIPEQETVLNVIRTADHFLQQTGRLLKRHGLSEPQYNVMRILRGNGGDGLSCSEIASQMVTYDPDITRLVDRLEKSKFVKRNRTEHDRRLVVVAITPKGLEVLEKLDEPMLDLHKEQLGHMPAKEQAELNRLLVKARRPPEEN